MDSLGHTVIFCGPKTRKNFWKCVYSNMSYLFPSTKVPFWLPISIKKYLISFLLNIIFAWDLEHAMSSSSTSWFPSRPMLPPLQVIMKSVPKTILFQSFKLQRYVSIKKYYINSHNSKQSKNSAVWIHLPWISTDKIQTDAYVKDFT